MACSASGAGASGPERTAPAILAYDPSDPAFHADPYPLYARLREEAPLHRSRGDAPAWVVTRYADCLEVLRRPDAGFAFGFDPHPGVQGVGHRSLARRAALHSEVRRLVSRAVTPWTVQRLRPAAERRVACLLEAIRGRDLVELMGEVAEPVAVALVCELLEVPAGDRARFREWAPDLAAALVSGTPNRCARPDAVRRACADYLARRVEEDERKPAGGLLTRLADAEEGARRMSRAERVTTSMQLAVASYVMARGLIGNLCLALLQHREALAAIRSDPSSVPYAVDECLRWDPPLQLGLRVALESFELRGQEIRAGQGVWLLIGAAHRDGRVFLEPDRFDPLRAGPPHLVRGFGGPFGIGAEVARLGAEVVADGLFRRIPRLVLAGDRLDRRRSAFFRSPERLPVAIAV